MQSPAQHQQAPSLAGGAELLCELDDDLRTIAALQARVVDRAHRLKASGTSRVLAGLTVDQWLRLEHGHTHGQSGTLLTAGDVLEDMPALADLFAAGAVSFGVVDAITAAAGRLRRDERAALDERLAASFANLASLSPDDIVAAAQVAVAELRGARSAEDAEDRADRAAFVWTQTSLFGRSKMYVEGGAAAMAGINAAIHAAAPAPDGRPLGQRHFDGLTGIADEYLHHRCECDCDGDHDEVHDDGVDDDVTDTDAAETAGVDVRRHGDADDTASEPASGDDVKAGDDDAADTGPAAGPHNNADRVGLSRRARKTARRTQSQRPRSRRRALARRAARALPIGVMVQLSDVTVSAAGTIHLASKGVLPTLTARLVDEMAADADIRAVLFDGATPLQPTANHAADDIPDKVKWAVWLRDGGICRYPLCDQPIEHFHHSEDARRGPTPSDPRYHYGLCKLDHLYSIHTLGWQGTIDPATAVVTWTWPATGATYTSLPKTTRLALPAGQPVERYAPRVRPKPAPPPPHDTVPWPDDPPPDGDLPPPRDHGPPPHGSATPV